MTHCWQRCGPDRGDVVCYSTSRLTRRPRQLEDWLDLHERRKVKVHFVNVNNDWSSVQGRAVARTLAAWDAAEAETIGDRVAFAAEAAAQRGRKHGGPRQFGYGTTVIKRVGGKEIRTHSNGAKLIRPRRRPSRSLSSARSKVTATCRSGASGTGRGY
jgi:DNA invertase Pin-like site-specific DNA recombinase